MLPAQKLRIAFASALVMGAAFCGFNTAYGSKANTVVARVNGQEVKLGEVNELKSALPKKLLEQAKDEDKLFAGLRDQLIDIKLVTENALKSGVEKDKDVKEAIKKATDQVVVQAYLAKEMKKYLTEAAIKKRYDELVKDFPKNEKETRAFHILVKDEKLAKDLIKRLDKKEDFLKLAREHSIDPASARKGGDLGYFTKAGMIPEFAEAAFKLAPGTYTKTPVKSQFGYHVIKVTDRRKLRAPKFADIKDRLGSDVMQRSMLKFVSGLREKAKIERFDRNGKPVKKEAKAAPSKKS